MSNTKIGRVENKEASCQCVFNCPKVLFVVDVVVVIFLVVFVIVVVFLVVVDITCCDIKGLLS